jgi:glycerol transport system ATP-binding protein
MNITEVRRSPEGVFFGGIDLPLSSGLNQLLQAASSNNVKIGIRPEFVQVSHEPTDGAYQCEVLFEEDLGTYKVLALQLGDWEIKAILEENAVSPTKTAYVTFPAQWLKLYIDDYLVEEVE